MNAVALVITLCLVRQSALANNLVEVLGPGGLISGNTAQKPGSTVSAVSGLTTGGSNISVISIGKNPAGGDSIIAVAPSSGNGGLSAGNLGVGKDPTNTGSLGSGGHLSLLDVGGGESSVPSTGTLTPKLPESDLGLITKPNAAGPAVKLSSCCNVNPKNWKASDAVVTYHTVPQAQLDYILAAAADATNIKDSPYDRCALLQQNLTSKYPRNSDKNGWYCVTGCGSMNQHGSYGWFSDDATFWFGDIKIEVLRPRNPDSNPCSGVSFGPVQPGSGSCGPLVMHAKGAQGDSKWSLDPFLGVYDMNWSEQVNMMKFSHGALGVPEAVVLGGERQHFNKTADGSRYIQTVNRPGANSTKFNSQLSFVLGVRQDVSGPNGTPLMSYTFDMTDDITLRGNYTFFGSPMDTMFTIHFIFDPSASTFVDVVHVSSLPHFSATALFSRRPCDEETCPSLKGTETKDIPHGLPGS